MTAAGRLLPRVMLLAGLVGALLLLPAAPGSRAGDARDEVRAALLGAADADDEAAALALALDDADRRLVGADAPFATRAELSDWLGTLPERVVEHEVVLVRRAWLYVAGRQGAAALPLLEVALERDPGNTLLTCYLGEARRQAGDLVGAIDAWVGALDAGAPDEQVLPSVRRLVFDLHRDRASDPAGALPRYVTVVEPILRRRRLPDVEEALYDWLDFDALGARPDGPRVAALRAAALRHLARALHREVGDEHRVRLARKAFEAARTLRATWPEGAPPEGVPTAFELLSAAVRLGVGFTDSGHEVPEALTALARVALEKGRFVLAASLARRRLAMSDSPGARAVLEALPPDVGD